MRNRDVLVTGSGIAGTTLAHLLCRYGFRPTVVERSPGPRTGGHAIDIRGTAREVIGHLGLVPQVRAALLAARGMAFIDERGHRQASFDPDVFGPSGGPAAEWTLLRTDLATILYEATKDEVEFVFDDAITEVTQDADGVTVAFEKGQSRRFDLVVGADGVHSDLRRMTFGPEERYVHDLDSYLCLYSVSSAMEHDWQLMYTMPGSDGRPGRTAGMRPLPGTDRALAAFFFRGRGFSYDRRDVEAQKQMVVRTFQDAGWVVPRVLPQIWDSPDFYFDRVEQVQMDTWSSDRVALVGDAAYCASPMSGIGTSLALVGAYVLAGELAKADGDHRIALPAYEAGMRAFVDRAQVFARTSGDGGLMPDTPTQMWLRNLSIRAMRFLPRRLVGRGLEKVADTVSLADHAAPSADRALTARRKAR